MSKATHVFVIACISLLTFFAQGKNDKSFLSAEKSFKSPWRVLGSLFSYGNSLNLPVDKSSIVHLPNKRAFYNPDTYILSNDFEITNVPKRREYWFELGTSTANPDGYTGDSFWLRVNAAVACLDGIPQWALGILKYESSGNDTNTGSLPETQQWSDLAAYEEPCRDLDERYNLSPTDVIDAYDTPFEAHAFSSQLSVFVADDGRSLDSFPINNISFQNQIYNPVLSIVEREGKFDTGTFNSIIYQEGFVDIILNNLDPIDHPFHIHGNDFQIIQRGFGNLTAKEVENMNLKVENPLRRDTIWIPGLSYAIVRYSTDNPGVWALHCHIGWHLSQGKLAVLIVRPDEIQRYPRPQALEDLCAGQVPSVVGPGRKRDIPFHRHAFHVVKEIKSNLLRRYGTP